MRCGHVDLHKKPSSVESYAKLQDVQNDIYSGSCQVRDVALDDHVWVSEMTTAQQEAKVLEALSAI